MPDTVPTMRAFPEALGARLRAALEDMATRVEAIGEVRGLGPGDRAPPLDRDSRPGGRRGRDRDGPFARPAAAGVHGNVTRLLPPLTIADDELTRGLEILEASLS